MKLYFFIDFALFLNVILMASEEIATDFQYLYYSCEMLSLLKKKKKKEKKETSHIYSLRPVLSEMSQSRGEGAADFDLHGSVSAPRRCNTCLTFKKGWAPWKS